jgi:hypothetical protein
MQPSTCGSAHRFREGVHALVERIRRSTSVLGLLAVAVTALANATGCTSSCDISDEGNPPEIFTGGGVRGDEYASSSSLGPLLYFPGGKQYQLVHHLGFTPNDIFFDIAFSANNSAMAGCAGNSCEKRCVDDQIIWVKNDTCTEFWLLVRASGPSPFPVPRCNGDEVDAGSLPIETIDSATAADALDIDP